MRVVMRMEMPQDGVCDGCGAMTVDSLAGPICAIEKKFLGSSRPSWCPIICALPEGHGRLGDLDELAAGCDSPYWCRWLSEIEDAPTLVPEDTAERSET